MEHTNGIPIGLASPAIWKGTNKSNGQLMPIRDYYLEVGYSGLVITAALQAELTAAGETGVPFGNGLFYDRNIKASAPNKVYAGYPTAAGNVPKLAGIMAYDQAIASLQPAAAKGVQPHNKGKIIKRGFVRYKTGKAAAGGAAVAYADINDATMVMFVENSTGDPVFAVPTSYTNGVPVLANCTYVGKIVQLYPEDESVLVELGF